MNSPFKMKARGNFEKTGRGIPAVFLQEKPKNKVEKVVDYIADRKLKDNFTNKEIENAKNLASGKGSTGLVPGTEQNKVTGEIKSKSFEKTYVEPSAENAFTASIRDSKGNIIESVKAQMTGGQMNPTGGKGVEALKSKYNKMKVDTEESRLANAKLQDFKINKLAGGGRPNA
jgi:hypothetical protein